VLKSRSVAGAASRTFLEKLHLHPQGVAFRVDRRKQRDFVASANYNQYLSTPAAIQDLINMIATFTAIGD
jgi:hypothetical protein